MFFHSYVDTSGDGSKINKERDGVSLAFDIVGPQWGTLFINKHDNVAFGMNDVRLNSKYN